LGDGGGRAALIREQAKRAIVGVEAELAAVQNVANAANRLKCIERLTFAG
jgi:hypothetical protein